MPRIPYRSPDDPGLEDLVAQMKARRGGPLLNLDRMLLNSPVFAGAWNGFLRTVRSQLSLDPKLFELVACFVGLLNRADYEFRIHAAEFLRAGGTQQQLDALAAEEDAAADTAVFDAAERAILALTWEMTRLAAAADETVAAARAVMPGPQQLLDLIGAIAAYNMVSRFVVVTGIDPEPP